MYSRFKEKLRFEWWLHHMTFLESLHFSFSNQLYWTQICLYSGKLWWSFIKWETEIINIPILGLVILPTVWPKAVLPDQRFGSVEEFCFIWKRICFSERQCRGPHVPSPWFFLSTKNLAKLSGITSCILPKASEMFLCKLLFRLQENISYNDTTETELKDWLCSTGTDCDQILF